MNVGIVPISMKCPNCGEDVRAQERNCSSCGQDCGYPNVRAAEQVEEVRALEIRVRTAEAAAAARGCADVPALFRDAVKSSEAVLCRRLGIAKNLIFSDNELYASFYQER